MDENEAKNKMQEAMGQMMMSNPEVLAKIPEYIERAGKALDALDSTAQGVRDIKAAMSVFYARLAKLEQTLAGIEAMLDAKEE